MQPTCCTAGHVAATSTHRPRFPGAHSPSPQLQERPDDESRAQRELEAAALLSALRTFRTDVAAPGGFIFRPGGQRARSCAALHSMSGNPLPHACPRPCRRPTSHLPAPSFLPTLPPSLTTCADDPHDPTAVLLENIDYRKIRDEEGARSEMYLR